MHLGLFLAIPNRSGLIRSTHHVRILYSSEPHVKAPHDSSFPIVTRAVLAPDRARQYLRIGRDVPQLMSCLSGMFSTHTIHGHSVSVSHIFRYRTTVFSNPWGLYKPSHYLACRHSCPDPQPWIFPLTPTSPSSPTVPPSTLLDPTRPITLWIPMRF
jgi:hypothetical protein